MAHSAVVYDRTNLYIVRFYLGLYLSVARAVPAMTDSPSKVLKQKITRPESWGTVHNWRHVTRQSSLSPTTSIQRLSQLSVILHQLLKLICAKQLETHFFLDVRRTKKEGSKIFWGREKIKWLSSTGEQGNISLGLPGACLTCLCVVSVELGLY